MESPPGPSASLRSFHRSRDSQGRGGSSSRLLNVEGLDFKLLHFPGASVQRGRPGGGSLSPAFTVQDIFIPGGLALPGLRLPRPPKDRASSVLHHHHPPPVGIKQKEIRVARPSGKRSFQNISGQQSEGGREALAAS